MNAQDEEFYDRCPVCFAHLYHHIGRNCEDTLPCIQELITWYSRGELPAATMQRTYVSPEAEVYRLIVTRRLPYDSR